MVVTTLEVDRNISKLRLHSKAFSEVTNKELATMFEQSLQNLKSIAYFWATIGADNKGVKESIAEGEAYKSLGFTGFIGKFSSHIRKGFHWAFIIGCFEHTAQQDRPRYNWNSIRLCNLWQRFMHQIGIRAAKIIVKFYLHTVSFT